jgi:hypothetical protein
MRIYREGDKKAIIRSTRYPVGAQLVYYIANTTGMNHIEIKSKVGSS